MGHQQRASELASRAASRSDEPRQIANARNKNRRDETHRTQKRSESQMAVPVAEHKSQNISHPQHNHPGTSSASPPPALQNLISFLQSQPDGSLKIPPEQIPEVAAYLVSAGLPSEEVERLLSSPGFSERGLSAADLEAAWQRSQSQEPSAETLAKSSAGPKQPSGGPNLPPEAQEILQNPDYRARWERLTLPEGMLPTLRLALARLGITPEGLARLEEESQGKGIPLSRVWQILQGGQNRVSLTEASPKSTLSPGENPSPSAMLEERPVTGEEVAEWRQILLEAGFKPEEVEKLLGQKSPANQEDLKSALMALAPPKEPISALSEPKPLYLPEHLRLSPFFWQGQANWDQSHLNGNGSGDQQYGAAAELAATSAEAFGLPAFAAELQMFNPNVPGTGAPLSNSGPAWHPFAPEMRESLWSQLQSGIISNLQPGESQVSLSLNPPDMGQIQLTLRLSGQELAVTAVASRPEVAELATQGVQQLLQALAQQGLVLTQFQVRLQEHPGGLTTAVLAGTREKNSESGEKFPAPHRRRSGEVDRFV